jgi:hypothetical protein
MQAFIAFLPTANGLLILIQEFIQQPPYRAVLPGWVIIAVNAAVVLGAFLAKAIAQLMANPAINSWFGRHASLLAATPKQGRPAAPTRPKESSNTWEAQDP